METNCTDEVPPRSRVAVPPCCPRAAHGLPPALRSSAGWWGGVAGRQGTPIGGVWAPGGGGSKSIKGTLENLNNQKTDFNSVSPFYHFGAPPYRAKQNRHPDTECRYLYAVVAQLIERLICNQRVGGLSPSSSSTRRGIWSRIQTGLINRPTWVRVPPPQPTEQNMAGSFFGWVPAPGCFF